MGTGILLIIALAALGIAWIMVKAALKFRGDRVVTCPENQQPAGVRVDALHAAFSSFGGGARLQLNACSRWPEKQDCGQDCLKQIEKSPENCLVRRIVADWYKGKSCAFCGKAIPEVHTVEHHAALVGPDNRSVQWADMPAEKIPEALASYRAVCWNCHVTTTVMRDHPELITDRGRTA